MGLCKCPERKITNLFCFEHACNVCEYCMVTEHERCIVQSYIQWLEDKDYNPICILCKRLLSDESTVRLICFDVFHWSCLNKYASSLPPNTAPAGYRCPKCKEGIFPQENIKSPIVDKLKVKLSKANWAKIGLGQPFFEGTSDKIEQLQSNVTEDESNGFVVVSKKQQQQPTLNSSLGNLRTTSRDNNDNNYPFLHGTSATKSKQIPNDLNRSFNSTKPFKEESKSHNRSALLYTNNNDANELILNINTDRDVGENKYKRRPLLEWFSRLIKSRQTPGKKQITNINKRRRCCFIFIMIIITFFTSIIIFSRIGSKHTNDDPFLDPMNNPNIRNQQSLQK